MQTMDNYLAKLVVCLVVVAISVTRRVHGVDFVPITYVTNAYEKGALCNDGSPAAYYYTPGLGDGVNNWQIYLNGGGWCNDDWSCRYRLNTPLGSSKYDKPYTYFGLMKSSDPTVNPDFYNWNKVDAPYCDSSSFMGITDHENIDSRGAKIFDAIMEELLKKGMTNATNAILYGTSAGGLATILHCDGFRSLFNKSSQVKCISDSGFFLHAPTLHGAERRAHFYGQVVAYHGFISKLSKSCTSKMNASLCIFPEHMVKYIRTPLFLIESKFDKYQLGAEYVSDDPSFGACLDTPTHCTPSQLQSIKEYGIAVTNILKEIRRTSSIGMFVQPRMMHGHLYFTTGWQSSYVMKNKTIAQAIGDWFYNRVKTFQEIDVDHELPLVQTPPNSNNYKPIPNI